MEERYGKATEKYENAAHLTKCLLLVTSACVFAEYLKDANGNYNRFTNNCQHFCKDLIKTLKAGEVSMPDGYQMNETPEKVTSGSRVNYNYAVTTT